MNRYILNAISTHWIIRSDAYSMRYAQLKKIYSFVEKEEAKGLQ